jgi:hypothetical protein
MGNGASKYGITMTSVVDGHSDNTYWYIVAWDTEIGRSKMYYGSVKEGTKAAHSRFQLPSSPL